jgi:hypothetical protein
MQQTNSSVSMISREEPSDGASSINYMTPLARGQSTESIEEWSILTDFTRHWQGTSHNATLRFYAGLDATGEVPQESRKAAVCRVMCVLLASRLDDESVISAYENMKDMYEWQLQASRLISKAPALSVMAISAMPVVERNPFVVDSDI